MHILAYLSDVLIKVGAIRARVFPGPWTQGRVEWGAQTWLATPAWGSGQLF